MALINTLRNKMGKIVVAFVAVAILSFTLNDILGSNSLFLGDNVVGEISGEKITIEEYRNNSDYMERYLQLTNPYGQTPTDAIVNQNTWMWLISQYAFSKQYRELGLTVGPDELWDLLQGSNIDPTVQSFFRGPDGQFDRQTFEDFYRNRNNPQYAGAKSIWDVIYPSLIPSRERLKYENLVIKSTYATQEEGMMDYHSQSDVAEVKYLYVPYYTLSDTVVSEQVSDAKLRERYNKNKKRYKVEDQRSLKYVVFPVVPSADDTLAIREEMEDLAEEFTNVDDDELFASANTDGIAGYTKYAKSALPYPLNERADSLMAGDIIGPVLDGSRFNLFKVTDVLEDTLGISSIERLITPSDATIDEEYRKADLFQSQVSNIEEFEAKAEELEMEVIEEKEIGPMDDGVGNLTRTSRNMVQWLYRDAKVGAVSDIFDVEDKYVVAVMTGKIEKGFKPFPLVENEIRVEVIRDLKAEYIKSKLKEASGTLNEIAVAYGEDAGVFESNDLKLESNSLPNVGFDPIAVGKIFSLESGEMSEPFATENGVLIAEMVNFTKAPEVADYSAFSEAIKTIRIYGGNNFENGVSSRIYNLVERNAEIDDRRYKVY